MRWSEVSLTKVHNSLEVIVSLSDGGKLKSLIEKMYPLSVNLEVWSSTIGSDKPSSYSPEISDYFVIHGRDL